MTSNAFTRAGKPANLIRFAVGASIVTVAALAAAPAFADQESEARTPAIAAARSVEQKDAGQVTAQSVLKIAESQVGVSENAAGGGTPFHSWYMASQRAKETVARDGGSLTAYANAPWCAMFVSWVGEQAGARPTVGWDAYTVTYAKWFESNGRWGDAAKPGAVVFYSWDDRSISSIDHVGLVKQDNGDGTITAIEGNTGNGKVEERVRPKSQVVGYGYPEYKA
ncbi:CHAP domain-containing protein [Nonomuraea sp. NN258]|uniref:CHAP domain-containing protein n=1 Tax=Nonomuraea antri TaxID=2730852 RepID=UPI0015688032|nr:CHAP domain-containing protein [Nonomuraea antri]NRQ39460.1 CHAP domain-containing protein [Nonomuraea antri]